MVVFKLALPGKRRKDESQVDQPAVQREENTIRTGRSRAEPHLTGLRGIFAVQSLIWIYFATFIPALVYPGEKGPVYQKLIRDVLSVPLWNASLISTGFILLSLRTIGITYLRAPGSPTYAGTLIRRIIRMTILLGIASGIATSMVVAMGVDFVNDFKQRLPNTSFPTPVVPYNGIAVANSIFNLFWLTNGFSTQAANSFWPSQTLWAPAVMYYEGFTVYIIMVIMPYTRPAWHWQVLTLFGIGSFWYQSWGWFAATALILADAASNPVLREQVKLGLKLKSGARIPTWACALLPFAIGVALKYFTTVLPRFENKLLILHPFLDLSQSQTPASFAAMGPYPRLDDFLIITSILLLADALDGVKKILSVKPLLFLGERAFSLFTAQSILVYGAGMKFWLWLVVNKGMRKTTANGVLLITLLPAVFVFAELYYRIIDRPSRWAAKRAFEWLTE